MPAVRDLSKERFGRLQPISRAFVRAGNTYWVCLCECGSKVVVSLPHLTTGHTQSCGCRRAERNYRHGNSGHRWKTGAYRSWDGMVQRCTNPNNSGYKNYGGRGIRVCGEWLDFRNFLRDMGDRPKGMSLDRINVDGNYEPNNCRWATQSEQNHNRRPYKWTIPHPMRGRHYGLPH